MRRIAWSAVLLWLFVPGCGGGGGDAPPSEIPAAAAAIDAKLKTGMVRFMPRVANVQTSLVAMLNPGTSMAQGITVAADTTPGAAPHSFTFRGPYDGNGDAINETNVDGRITFNGDPDTAWSGASGEATIDVSIPVVGHLYHAVVAFTIQSDERRIAGSGSFTDPVSGDVTTMTVSAAAPLVIKAADGTADAVSNACGNSVSGQVRLDVAGATGDLTSLWNFSPTRTGVEVSGASFTDKSGLKTTLPDATVDLRCGGSGTLSDWAAVFEQRYVCLPRESGQARLTIATAGADTVSITDEDPPGSGSINTYQATVLGSNPYALRGFFIAGPAGNRYREDFNWTLSANGSVFSQVSKYVFTEGANAGRGGICVATARRF